MRRAAANKELDELLQDRKDFPINYNHYYTDTITAKRQERLQKQVLDKLPAGTIDMALCHSDFQRAFHKWGTSATADMEAFSCEEALDSLLAIYKVSGNFCI